MIVLVDSYFVFGAFLIPITGRLKTIPPFPLADLISKSNFGCQNGGIKWESKVPEFFQFRDWSLDFGYFWHMLIFVFFDENTQYFH